MSKKKAVDKRTNGTPPRQGGDPFVTLNLRKSQILNVLAIINGFGKPGQGFSGEQVEVVAILKQDIANCLKTSEKLRAKRQQKESVAVPGGSGAKSSKRRGRGV